MKNDHEIAQIYNNTDEHMVQMLNAHIFITNKYDSDAWLAALCQTLETPKIGAHA